MKLFLRLQRFYAKSDTNYVTLIDKIINVITMKNLKYYTTLICLIVVGFAYSQEVVYKGATYTVKKGLIYAEGNDVTSTLSLEDQTQIKSVYRSNVAELKKQEEAEKRLKNQEKGRKKAEKKQKEAEKKLKKIEKQLQRKEKAEKAVLRAQSNLEDAQNKYEKLSKRGKLSPNDEAKWLEKIKKLGDRVNSAKNKLSRL